MPTRSFLRPSVAAALASLLASPAAAGTTHTISTWTMSMTPVTVDAAVGDEVAWTNVAAGHTVDYLPDLDGMNLNPQTDGDEICASLAGAVRIDAGGSASVDLAQAGIFYYVCAAAFPLHCDSGMRVRVNVGTMAVEPGAWGRIKALYR
jgi:plastocyanin